MYVCTNVLGLYGRKRRDVSRWKGEKLSRLALSLFLSLCLGTAKGYGLEKFLSAWTWHENRSADEKCKIVTGIVKRVWREERAASETRREMMLQAGPKKLQLQLRHMVHKPMACQLKFLDNPSKNLLNIRKQQKNGVRRGEARQGKARRM